MRQGKVKLFLDNEWDFLKFSELPRDYIQLYSLFFFCQEPLEPLTKREWAGEFRDRLFYTFTRQPWIGGFSVVNFYNDLYYQIPPKLRPKIVSIRFSSPGFIELGVVIGVARTIAYLVDVVCNSIKNINSVYGEIHEGLRERKLNKKNLKRLTKTGRKKRLSLHSEDKEFIDESLSAFSDLLKIDPKTSKSLEVLTNSNKLLQLKILLSAYRRIKSIAKQQNAGDVKLIIPDKKKEGK